MLYSLTFPPLPSFLNSEWLQNYDGLRGGGLALAPLKARARLSYPSSTMARYEIPEQLPEFVECADAFIPSNEATVEEWQRHKNPDKSVHQILKLAGKLALPDNVPLLPRLRALARANVLAFNRKF